MVNYGWERVLKLERSLKVNSFPVSINGKWARWLGCSSHCEIHWRLADEQGLLQLKWQTVHAPLAGKHVVTHFHWILVLLRVFVGWPSESDTFSNSFFSSIIAIWYYCTGWGGQILHPILLGPTVCATFSAGHQPCDTKRRTKGCAETQDS